MKVSIRKDIFTAERTVHRRVAVSKVTLTTIMNKVTDTESVTHTYANRD